MIKVIIESPYADGIEQHIEYARECVKDSLMRGESPIASHLLYTQPNILNDESEEEREMGIEAGLAWLSVADKHVFYVDLGVSSGMQIAAEQSKKLDIPTEYRTIRS